MTKPLENVRVLELGTMITAPLAAMMLADLGADVIKIERPEGDPFRGFRGGQDSPHFAAYNRNKRSVRLDLQQAKPREALRRLLASSDILIDNYRPDVMARFGLNFEALSARFPRLITCSITGFGPTGPYSGRPAFDAVASALAGIYSLTLDPEHPRTAGPTIVDNITGMFACSGILAALHTRSVTGRGSKVETNMLEAAVSFIPDAFSTYTMLGVESGPRTRVATSQSFVFKCGDAKLLAIHLSSPVKFWGALVAAIARPELLTDARFATRVARVEHFEALEAELASVFARRARKEWMQLLDTHDVPFAPVQSVAEVMDDPQVQHLGTFYASEHAGDGTRVGISPPLWFDGTRAHARRPPPALGEHNGELLAECGFSTEEIGAISGG